MKQHDLLTTPERGATPPHNGTDTSRDAAEFVRPRATQMGLDVLRFIVDRFDAGATADEAGAMLGMRPQTVSARCCELLRKQWIRRSGQKRPTSSGCPAHVYLATAEGIRAAAEGRNS
ncbi:MAG: hypothetical protein JNM18_12680 [Planctomycetaceae bacterium]|nr:hypothetical protein [Planctomycetaceae bacterium]